MRPRATVIAYHAIGSCLPEDDPHELFISEETFEAQMAYLARHREVVPLEALVRGKDRSAKPIVAITLDDAYTSVLHTAVPILSRYGFPSTVFVPTGWLGRPNGWVEAPSRPIDVMDEGQLLETERKGIQVESHGHAHINYENADPREIEDDVETSIELLTDILGRPPRYFAYPYGPTSSPAQAIVERAGLEAAFTLERPHGGRFAFERTWIRPRYDLRVFALKTSGYWAASWRWSKAGRVAAALVRPFAGRRR